MNVVELENVDKTFTLGEAKIHALDHVSLTFAEGEFTAVVGPSGSGKTTLLQMMGCLDRPDSGVVRVKGHDVTRLGADQRADLRRDLIGFIFQFFALVPVLSAYENVELPLLLANVPAEERRKRVQALLEAVDLTDRADHRPDQLSGGEQQRAAIARALAPRPALVLADEPTANLDTPNGHRAMEIMRKLNEETGTAFLFATHDPRVVAFARRVVEMRDGRVVGDGRPADPAAATRVDAEPAAMPR
jgi:putative ABC transport system ATP-binding protein